MSYHRGLGNCLHAATHPLLIKSAEVSYCVSEKYFVSMALRCICVSVPINVTDVSEYFSYIMSMNIVLSQ